MKVSVFVIVFCVTLCGIITVDAAQDDPRVRDSARQFATVSKLIEAGPFPIGESNAVEAIGVFPQSLGELLQVRFDQITLTAVPRYGLENLSPYDSNYMTFGDCSGHPPNGVHLNVGLTGLPLFSNTLEWSTTLVTGPQDDNPDDFSGEGGVTWSELFRDTVSKTILEPDTIEKFVGFGGESVLLKLDFFASMSACGGNNSSSFTAGDMMLRGKVSYDYFPMVARDVR